MCVCVCVCVCECNWHVHVGTYQDLHYLEDCHHQQVARQDLYHLEHCHHLLCPDLDYGVPPLLATTLGGRGSNGTPISSMLYIHSGWLSNPCSS